METSGMTEPGTSNLKFSIPLVIEELAGINRLNEPVTVGIPFPQGVLSDVGNLIIIDSTGNRIPLQAEILATWPDSSAKWVLMDFQVSVKSRVKDELNIVLAQPSEHDKHQFPLLVEESDEVVRIRTKSVSFCINKKKFKPFERVIVNGNDVLCGENNDFVLTDESGTNYEPYIDRIDVETKGPVRSTLKVEGTFRKNDETNFARFHSRVTFFAHHPIVKIDFTLHNPKAARHPGGLWDLGDPGSIFFKDLSMHTVLETDSTTASYSLSEDPSPMDYQDLGKSDTHFEHKTIPGDKVLTLYQDSSGGENWMSRNHVNRFNEVKNSFRGYRIISGEKIVKEGLRANPIVRLQGNGIAIEAAVLNFWQNFPKALEIDANIITIRLFPKQYDDSYELQGGEQKTHTIFLNFANDQNENPGLAWVNAPLIARSTPKWYAESLAFSFLMPDDDNTTNEMASFIDPAVNGDRTFFYRREIIDEYGWRNFGELYADHEAIGHEGPQPLVSHYNNQYDCIYGALFQFVRTGEPRWFILADQLCRHVTDIDIYHTDKDRPEFNHGLFWHTEHYLDVQTATHRCCSIRHAPYRELANYGGGPALSHNYSSGLLYHYYLTGCRSSYESGIELAGFIENNIAMSITLACSGIKKIKEIKSKLKQLLGKETLVQIEKVYGVDGPGRASGNAVNTLLDAYLMTSEPKYLDLVHFLIRNCIHPEDNIEKRDLLDAENRWMYTIFLQALSKYILLGPDDSEIYYYAISSLLHYANWMSENEYPYLDKPEKLEYPNETWAAQDIRKCNIMIVASHFAESPFREKLIEKATFFYHSAVKYFSGFETRRLTRPIVLMMLNGMVYGHYSCFSFKSEPNYYTSDTSEKEIKTVAFSSLRALFNHSYKRELEYFKWLIISKF
jgi:hypothetical protein